MWPNGKRRAESMELTAFFKSVLEQDRAAVVLCDLSHTIVYMNPAAGALRGARRHGPGGPEPAGLPRLQVQRAD